MSDAAAGAPAPYVSRYPSPLGGITLVCDGGVLTGLRFDGQRGFEDAPAAPTAGEEPAVISLAKEWLDVYFSGREPGFTPPLRLDGTPFQKAVWDILLTIPYGRTATYGEIAKVIEERLCVKKMSAQAVGGAVGRNPVSLIVPCHRVVGSDGSLTGYAGGIGRKRRLLELEGAGINDMSLPGNARREK